MPKEIAELMKAHAKQFERSGKMRDEERTSSVIFLHGLAGCDRGYRQGPSYGLQGVPTIPPVSGTADIVALYEMYSSEPPPDYPAHVWPRGLVPLIGGGCLYMECVDFLRPPHAVVMFDGNDCDFRQPVGASLAPVAGSLAEHLESWLAGAGHGQQRDAAPGTSLGGGR